MDTTRPRIIAVAGGKGGVGKSLLAANVGIYLATIGKRVVLVDAALGSANLHTFVGEVRPQRTIAELLGNDDVDLEAIAEPTPIPGVRLIAGERDPSWIAHPRVGQIKRLAELLPQLEADVVVIDLPSGTNALLLELFLIADIKVSVVVPEPTSVELCYRLIRAAFIRELKRSGLSEAAKISAAEQQEFESGIPSALDIYFRAMDRDPVVAQSLRETMQSFRPNLIVNCARSKSDMELGKSMAGAARRRMGLPIGSLGHVEYDEAVWVALRRKRPLIVEHPESRVAKCIEKLSRKMIGYNETPSPLVFDESHYELFDVAPTASFEDIRRANRRIREVYSSHSVVTTGLYTQQRLEDLHRQIEGAYRTLMDSTRRKEYDLELFPDGLPSRMILGDPAVTAALEAPPPEDRPDMPVITPDTDFTGALLQRIREAKGIQLRDIAERSKIGMAYLTSIEEERFNKLPAVVYVRGFLVQYATILAVDPDRVLDTYLERYRKARRALDAEDQ